MFYRTICFLFTFLFIICSVNTPIRLEGGALASCMASAGALDVHAKTGNRISPYDALIREESRREGHDWRLLSAIAYNESRFNSQITSPKGARGLMQIMPAVARQYDIPEATLEDPRTNVRLAAKILSRIERSLGLSRSASEEDRTCIILACYNGGIGHVSDARKLAVKYGADPNRWEDVSTYLQLKSDSTYLGDEVVKCGSFNGSDQTIAFVDNVMGKYRSYCRRADL